MSCDHHVLWWYRRGMFSILPDNAINDHWTNSWKHVLFIRTYKLWWRCRWTSISGSVISYYMMTPKACMLVNTIAYFGSLAISFAGAAIVLKAFKHDEEEEGIKELAATADAKIQKLNKVIFACDAGMGSSAMGVTILKKN